MKEFFEKISFPLSLIACVFCFLPLFGLQVQAITFMLCAFCAIAYFQTEKVGLGAIWAFTAIIWMIQI